MPETSGEVVEFLLQPESVVVREPSVSLGIEHSGPAQQQRFDRKDRLFDVAQVAVTHGTGQLYVGFAVAARTDRFEERDIERLVPVVSRFGVEPEEVVVFAFEPFDC